ncbi:MAG: hypothetical protein AAFR23_06975 [Pseudomonadota bacterium]
MANQNNTVAPNSRATDGGETVRLSQSTRPRSRWWPALIGFAAGVAVSQAFGVWVFLAAVVQGIPAPPWNGTAELVRVLAPEGAAKLARINEMGVGVGSASGCTTLALPAKGLGAEPGVCPERATAGLRDIPGTAPKNNRLGLSKPLVMTMRAPEAAPVAGWAARIGPTGRDAGTSDADTSNARAARIDDSPELAPSGTTGGWATVATPGQ